MPKSKRAKVVHLSKTTKKGKELARKTLASVQECVPLYSYIYVFRVDNMRNNHLKDVRVKLASDSRLIYGKSRIMALALGRNAETEPALNTSKLGGYVTGDVGLLFSQRAPDEILDFFLDFTSQDYARSGAIAPRDFTIPAGVVYSRAGGVDVHDDIPLASSMEPNLRKLGVPTKLVRAKIELENDFPVCKQGDVLGSGQTTLLKTFGVMMATFHIKIVASYERDTGVVRELQGDDDAGRGVMDVDVDVDGLEADDEDDEVGGVAT